MIEIRQHFNEPVLMYNRLGRLIGYAESPDKQASCLVVKQIGGDVNHYPVESTMIFLDKLKGQNRKMSKDGLIWDDFIRLDSYLTSSGCTREPRFVFHELNIGGNESVQGNT